MGAEVILSLLIRCQQRGKNLRPETVEHHPVAIFTLPPAASAARTLHHLAGIRVKRMPHRKLSKRQFAGNDTGTANIELPNRWCGSGKGFLLSDGLRFRQIDPVPMIQTTKTTHAGWTQTTGTARLIGLAPQRSAKYP